MARPTTELSDTPLLTQTAEYAFRALAELAIAGDAQPLRAGDLAARTQVPEAYLSKVMRRLVERGLVHAQKGHHGGFSLARAAEQIRFVDVLSALDAMPSSRRCAFGWGRCNAAHPCPLHPAWSRLNDAFSDWAEATTLADVARADTRRRLIPLARETRRASSRSSGGRRA
jgi:Rrf2 family protein